MIRNLRFSSLLICAMIALTSAHPHEDRDYRIYKSYRIGFTAPLPPIPCEILLLKLQYAARLPDDAIREVHTVVDESATIELDTKYVKTVFHKVRNDLLIVDWINSPNGRATYIKPVEPIEYKGLRKRRQAGNPCHVNNEDSESRKDTGYDWDQETDPYKSMARVDDSTYRIEGFDSKGSSEERREQAENTCGVLSKENVSGQCMGRITDCPDFMECAGIFMGKDQMPDISDIKDDCSLQEKCSCTISFIIYCDQTIDLPAFLECFNGDAQVQTPSGKLSMRELHMTPEAQVQVFTSSNRVEYAPLLLWLHAEDASSIFVEITTLSGRQLKLTPNHVIFRSDCWTEGRSSIYAGDLRPGDCVAVVHADSSSLRNDEVVSVSRLRSKGRYAFVTTTGTVMVNGIAASNYAGTLHIGLVHDLFMIYVRIGQWIFHMLQGTTVICGMNGSLNEFATTMFSLRMYM